MVNLRKFLLQQINKAFILHIISMYKGKKILAIIPARGGSKIVKGKNIRLLAGKPLIAWSIEAAKESQYIDRVILSSDDSEIIEVAKQWQCEVPFVRPQELARDDTPGIEPILHALQEIPGYDYIILLQPTSPIRSSEDIDQSIKQCLDWDGKSLVSVVVPEKSPYWMYQKDEQGLISPLIQEEEILQRQLLPTVYAVNGAIYVSEVSALLKEHTLLTKETYAYIMPKERSIDIDTELDIKIAELLLTEKKILK
jgi:CMP-N,N'-diacetyllegionaminic acid synthase